MNKSKVKILFVDFVLFIILLAGDRFTKYLAIAKLKEQDAIVLIQDVLELQYLENRGSAFGMFQNQKVFILCVGTIFMMLMLFFLLRMPAEKKYVPANIVLTLVMAGGIGNMIDRIRFDFVVDFISFVLINFPIFNVADIYVVVGTIALFILFMFIYKEKDLDFLSFKQN